ncbi:MAG: ACT domain-containing protein, partial [Synergistota bacterium]|nr:ACT domain-containing protein [Synergistota bacterium]
EVPDWAWAGEFVSITKTPEELSIVCRQVDVPKNVRCEKDWRCLKVNGPLNFTCVGILASLSVPLSKAGVSIFAVSTYDTDYLLVKEKDLEHTILVLNREGHIVEQ